MHNTPPNLEGGQGPGTSHAAPNSLLVADCGTVFTKVSLFGLVEGQYRLMARGEAPTTVAPPYEDITKGIIQAINTLEFITGRRFISDGRLVSPEQENGDGVDAFVSTISAAGPLRLVVLGAVSPMLDEMSAQAVSALYAETHALAATSYIASSTPAPVPVGAGVSSAPTPQSVGGQWTTDRLALERERQLERLRELQPHAALIVGMAEGPVGPYALQEACQLLIDVSPQLHELRQSNMADTAGANPAGSHTAKAPLPVVYAGAPQYVDAVRQMLSHTAEVLRVDPLISQKDLKSVSMAANALYERQVMQRIPGYARLNSWSTVPPMATATSLSSLVRFLAQHYAMNVIAVDIGGATTTVMKAGEAGEFIPLVKSGIGTGSGVGAILQQVGLQRVTRWLPFDITEDELRQYVLNHMLHPHIIPTNTRHLQIGQAFAREAMILTVEKTKRNNPEWFDTDLILATGGILAHAPKYGQVALMLLDALQPRGVTSLVLDRTMLTPQLGALATVAPVAAVQINESDAVTHRLGTCVIPFGTLPPPGQPALRVGVEYKNGRQMTVDVMSGSLEVIPLRNNEEALLTLFPSPTVDVGLGPGERARAAEEIDGGLVGLIIDARGRPLVLPSNEKERQARLLQWMQVVGA